MIRFFTQSLLARCFSAVLCVLIACFLAVPPCLSGVFKPDTAHAEETRSWMYAGDKVVCEKWDGYFAGYGGDWRTDTKISYSGSSLDAKSNLIDEDTDALDGVYEESYSWATPPSSIFVGDEANVALDVSLSMSYAALDEYDSYSYAVGYANVDVYLILSEYDPNARGWSQYEIYGGEPPMVKDKGEVSTSGTTEFAKVQRLNYIRLTDGKEHNPVNVIWDELESLYKNEAREFQLSQNVRFKAEDASSSLYWKYGKQLADGNYKIDTGENAFNYDGPGKYEAQAYLLTLRVYIGNAGYTHDYYYTFIPGAAPVATTTTSGESEEPKADPQNVVVETEAPKESGESGGSNNGSGGWVIPAAIVGLVVVGGGVALSRRNRKPKGDLPPDDKGSDDDQPQKSSTYRMVLWKDFGDTIVAGAGPQKIGARIEEVKPDGAVVFRSDLTAKISFSVSENIIAENLGMLDPYQCISVEAVAPIVSDTGIVSIRFTGEGGSFTNNVKFKIAELQLVFPDVPLTFVAGKQQTFQMPFKFSLESIAQGPEPRFEVHFANSDTTSRFKDARVVRDAEYPEKLFAVEMTECGPVKEDDIPGTTETYMCEVTATLPAGVIGSDECKVNGSFSFFRFHEGLRFTVEPLKCYYVKHVEKQEDLVNASEALDIAANLQTQTMGLAGGLASAVGAAAVMRETERDLKERFPEVFREDDVYVFDKRDKVMLTPGRTHAYMTLFVVDEFQDEYGKPYLRPITPLPKKDDMQLAFEDVDGSSVLHDKDGKEIAKPVETLDFQYFIKKVQHTDNTVVFEILPTKGVMLPPNRSQVDVAAVVRWTDHAGEIRTFTATERVNAISQPYRVDYIDKADEYIAGDDEIRKMLYGIQAKIQGRYTGGLAAKGSISVGQTAADVFAGMRDAVDEHPLLAMNPVTAPGVALYQLYISARDLGQSIASQSKDVYYDNLMPIYHYIEMMLEGHEYEFGFYDYDVKRIVTTFARFENGQLGAAEAIDLAYHGHDMMFADALSMTVQDWNHSWTSIGVRVGFAIVTGGQSEWLFMPMGAIGAGMEASMNYIDHGGDNLLEAYRVGLNASAKHALIEAAVMGAFTVVGKCLKTAWVIAKEGFSQRQLFTKALKEMFSTAKYGKGVAQAAKGIEGQLARAGVKADAAIRAFRGSAQAGQSIEREIAYTLGRLEGGYKLDALKDLIAGGGKSLNPFQQRAMIVAIQSDKHAMRALMEATGPEAEAMRTFFSRAMGQIEKDALLKARVSLSSKLKIPMDKLRVKGTSGNAGKVSMDMDATFQYFDDAAGQWKDVKAALGQETFDAEFYKIVKGYAAESDDVAAAFTRRADMTITDAWHPEAYSPDYADALRVVDASRAGEAFTYGSKVANVAKYKCDHWLDLARKAAADAKAAQAAGKLVDAQGLAAASEAFAEESARQFTKQADRLIINKIAAMQAKGIKVSTSVNIDLFLEKVAVLKRSGMGRFGGSGLTSGEVDAVLKSGYETGLDALFSDLEKLTVELDNAIKAAAK